MKHNNQLYTPLRGLAACRYIIHCYVAVLVIRRDGESLGTKTKSIGRWGRGPECDFVFVPLFLNSGVGRAHDKDILYSAFRMAYGFVAAG